MKLFHFNEHLQGVCAKPGLFVGTRDFKLVCAYLDGFAGCIAITTNQVWYMGRFAGWLADNYGSGNPAVRYTTFITNNTYNEAPISTLAQYFQKFTDAQVPPLEQLANASDTSYKAPEQSGKK